MGARYRSVTLILAIVSGLLLGGGEWAYALTTTTYNSTDIPKTVGSGSPAIRSEVVVPCSQVIVDVNVQLDISHPYTSDLDIYLIAPDGTRIELSTDNGGTESNYSGTIFDDQATNSITVGTAPFAGSYQPEGNLYDLNLKGTGGTWTLEVTDDVPSIDDGTLNSWSLIVRTQDNGTYPSTDGVKMLADPGTTTSTVPVCTTGKIVDLEVLLLIIHSRDEDLDIALIAPDGTRVELSTDNGGTGDYYYYTRFDDDAVTAINAGAPDAVPPFTGSYRPEKPLSVLHGMEANGTWTLEVVDDETGFAGHLDYWELRMRIDASPAPYKVSTFVAGLPALPAGLAVDPCRRDFYFAELGDCEGILRKISPDGTVSMVTGDFTPSGGPGCVGSYYSSFHADIELLNGHVYVPLQEGELVKIDTASGTTTVEHNFSTSLYNSDIAARGKQLLVTSGTAPPPEIHSYNTSTRSASRLLDVSPLPYVFSVEYDPVYDKVYFWSSSMVSNFYQMDYGASTYRPLAGGHTGSMDFAVSPDGKNLVKRSSEGHLGLVSIANGSVTPLVHGLTGGPRYDLVFGPSTEGSGCSLFVPDMMSIREISGFSGECGCPFPWPTVVAAIAGSKRAKLPPPQWGVLNTVCCEYSNGSPSPTTFSLVSGGVTRTSSLASCSSTATFGGPAVSTAGSQAFTWNWSSPGCGAESGSFSYTLAKGMAYLFVAEFEPPSDIVVKVYSAPIKTTAATDTDLALDSEKLALQFNREDMELVDTIPLGTFEGSGDGGSCQAAETASPLEIK